MRRNALMTKKFRAMPVLTGLIAVLLAAALVSSARGGDDLSIEKIMEQVQARNRALGTGLRARSALEASGRKKLAADAAFLVQLGKEARTLTGPARVRKKSQQEWARTVDGFLRSSEEFAKVIADPESSRVQSMKSYQKIQKTCLNCHVAFREQVDPSVDHPQ
jgi:hypothetical protein